MTDGDVVIETCPAIYLHASFGKHFFMPEYVASGNMVTYGKTGFSKYLLPEYENERFGEIW